MCWLTYFSNTLQLIYILWCPIVDMLVMLLIQPYLDLSLFLLDLFFEAVKLYYGFMVSLYYRLLPMHPMSTQKILKLLHMASMIWQSWLICTNQGFCRIWDVDMILMKFMWVFICWFLWTSPTCASIHFPERSLSLTHSVVILCVHTSM